MWGRILIFSCVLPWPSAGAAPWIQDEGGWYTRVSLVSEEVEGLQGYRRDAYLEYGWTEDWTLTLKGEEVSYSETNGFDSKGWRATARRLLYSSDSINVSAELGLLQGAAIGGRNGCDRLGVEARGGISWSGRWRKQSTFAFVEGAGRFHGACDRQRLEGGFGIESYPAMWTITQVWIERGALDAQSDKIQTELLWRTDFADWSAGYRYEVGNTFQEEGVFLAIAKQF